MSFFESLSRWLGFSQEVAPEGPRASHGDNDNGRRASAAAEVEARPAQVASQTGGSSTATAVADGRFDDIDADVIEDKPAQSPIVAPRSRAELINELKNNYTEVLGLVRKVDTHLDAERQRADQLLRITQETSTKLDALPELAEQNRRIADSIARLVELTQSGQEADRDSAERLTKTAVQQLESAQQQTAALQQVQSAVHKSGEAERELAKSVGSMTKATDELGETITAMRQTDTAREEELAGLVRNSQRGLIALVVITGLLAIGTLAAVVFGVQVGG